ncbi:MAG TPA: 2Fe-2S iron-sulfur cluster-binding protein [Trebonia sp.]|jgi:NADP-reducing hydrogenase subunit HndD|nr:2Fe-2S iron-sulfur cluster-binding protein [Trebonia sp.]
MTAVFLQTPRRLVDVTIDGQPVRVPEGATLLEACRRQGIDTPTLCYLENLTPVNVCRVCVVEVEGSRALVPACSRKAEPGMTVRTDSERVRTSRKMVLEFLASSADISLASPDVRRWLAEYGADPGRYGPPEAEHAAGERDAARPGEHHAPDGASAATVRQPVKYDNESYVRDYSRCILCYKCVEACGEDAQNTFAIAVAGRGFDARISTEYDVSLPGSACVYCGNCIGVCPTGALMPVSEYMMRQSGTWDEARQTVTTTICPYCGVGCNLELHVQDNQIVKVTSPLESDVSHGHLCVKGRFGFEFVQRRAGEP